MTPRILQRSLGIAAVALLILGPAIGTAAAEQGSIEPRAGEILKAALSHLASAQSVAVRAELVEETTLSPGQKLQYPGTLEILMRRPARLRYRLDTPQADLRQGVLVCEVVER